MDIHFTLIFSDLLRIADSQAANGLKVQLNYTYTVTVSIPHRLWGKGRPILFFVGTYNLLSAFPSVLKKTLASV